MQPEIIVKELARMDRAALEAHFLALGMADRRLRFGALLSDAAVRTYVARIDFDRDAVFGVLDDELMLVGVAHVARGIRHAELGVSVSSGHRGRGIGARLLQRAHTRARNWGVPSLFMHCLSENGTMMHLARKQGMSVVAVSGEADAWLALPPADASTHFGEVFAQRVALLDAALKAQLVNTRRLAEALTPGTASPARGR
jgi:GNAT superfamily N-acetyltransferase